MEADSDDTATGMDENLASLGLDQNIEPAIAAEQAIGVVEMEPGHPNGAATGSVQIMAGQPIPKRAPSMTGPEQRKAFIDKLKGQPLMAPNDKRFMHGWAYEGPMVRPNVLWASDQKPRKDHDAPDWLTATEFADTDKVMAAKITQLAALMRMSRHTCVYSGAGISASAVGQAALSGVNKVGWKNKTEAQPTLTHHALAVLGRTGWVHGWVQQNHDGLPQKAGFPQEAICEVHGSWYDPSNPVVKYSGSLKEHECAWMEAETNRADLVLVMGTSLGGLFADQVATECAMRAARGEALGACIINLQQTAEDDKMTLNFSGKSDDVLVRLLRELELPALPKVPQAVVWPAEECVLVPYDAEGVRLPEGSNAPRMWLDLSRGAKLKLSKSHNCQGARQPNTIHIGSKKGQKFNNKPIPNAGAQPGVGSSMGREVQTASIKLSIEGATMRMGIWWLEAASRGGPAMLPVVNVSPAFEGAPAPSARAGSKAPAAAAAPAGAAAKRRVGK